ncbi:MAG: hypothetical protein V3W44_01920 [Dehalococcoidales bacterium]
MGGDTGLRELVEAKSGHMETRSGRLERTVEKQADSTIGRERFDSATLKIRDLHAGARQTDKRLDGIEKRQDAADGRAKVYRYIGGIVVTVATALVIAWLAGML